MSDQFAKYASFSVEDLLEDLPFRRWVLRNEKPEFWQTFLLRHPDRRAVVEQAIELLRRLDTENPRVSLTAAESDALYNTVRRKIGETNSAPTQISRLKRRRWWLYAGVAAAASVLLLLGLSWWFTPVPELMVTTGNGEQVKFYLPDSSLVELNANSRLTYPARWRSGDDRRVRLQGEGFFTVRKLSRSRFTVETGPLEIQVLGTRFNVHSRSGRTAVALEEGSVRLTVQDEDQAVTMQPGEVVTYRSEAGLSRQTDAALDELLSWRRGALIFNDATLAEVAEKFEELYGKNVAFSDDDLRQIKVRLSVPVNDAGKFVQTLRILFEQRLRVEESEEGLYIKEK